MKILALIPARSGSKRLPGKNLRLLGGKPMIVWSIEAAKGIPQICDILVSTDCSEIASVCKNACVLVPWLRPDDLATDTATSVDVARHALDWYQREMGEVDGLLLLQPTSPFRTKETIKKGVALFEKHLKEPVVGVSQTHEHPLWAMKREGDYLVPFIPGDGLATRSQDLPAAFTINGSFYLMSPSDLKAGNLFTGKKAIPLIVESPQEALDIDTAWDFMIAETVVSQRMEHNL